MEGSSANSGLRFKKRELELREKRISQFSAAIFPIPSQPNGVVLRRRLVADSFPSSWSYQGPYKAAATASKQAHSGKTSRVVKWTQAVERSLHTRLLTRQDLLSPDIL